MIIVVHESWLWLMSGQNKLPETAGTANKYPFIAKPVNVTAL